jgi:hypothetical protein
MTRPDICLQSQRKGDSVNMEKDVIKRYSIAFKKQVVSEYEAGSSLKSLQQRYGIGGDHTVSRWVEQYGREGLRARWRSFARHCLCECDSHLHGKQDQAPTGSSSRSASGCAQF